MREPGNTIRPAVICGAESRRSRNRPVRKTPMENPAVRAQKSQPRMGRNNLASGLRDGAVTVHCSGTRESSAASRTAHLNSHEFSYQNSVRDRCPAKWGWLRRLLMELPRDCVTINGELRPGQNPGEASVARSV